MFHFGLTTYHSQLVLVGGREYASGKDTNKIWTLSEHGQWQETLPPMPVSSLFASIVSSGDHLLVISDDTFSRRIYMYNGHHWASVQHPLPQHMSYYDIKSILFDGHWYIMGRVSSSQRKEVYSASVDSLLASCQPSETSQPSPLWKRLTDIPSSDCYPAVFGNRLVAVTAGRDSHYTTTSVYAYSSSTDSWVHVGDATDSTWSYAPCAVVFPSNELMIVRGNKAFKIIIKRKRTDLMILSIIHFSDVLQEREEWCAHS